MCVCVPAGLAAWIPSSGYCHRWPHTRWLETTEIHSLPVPGGRSLKPRGWQGALLLVDLGEDPLRPQPPTGGSRCPPRPHLSTLSVRPHPDSSAAPVLVTRSRWPLGPARVIPAPRTLTYSRLWKVRCEGLQSRAPRFFGVVGQPTARCCQGRRRPRGSLQADCVRTHSGSRVLSLE